MTVSVLHDADVDGYNIARTLRAATATSAHAVQVVDLGLAVADALTTGLEPERTLRKKDLPADPRRGLSAQEREFFASQYLGGHPWEGWRVELNAFASADLIGYVEPKLRAEGPTAKVLPPQEVVAAKARDALTAEVRETVTAEVARLLDLDAIAARLSEQVVATMEVAAPSRQRAPRDPRQPTRTLGCHHQRAGGHRQLPQRRGRRRSRSRPRHYDRMMAQSGVRNGRRRWGRNWRPGGSAGRRRQRAGTAGM